MDGYQALAEAIIAQAAMDYLEAMRVIRDYPDAKGAMKEIRRIERFIHSAWFGVLTKADPDYLIGQMRDAASSYLDRTQGRKEYAYGSHGK